MLFFLFICGIAQEEIAGIGGFITFAFPFEVEKVNFFSKLSVVVKSPQGSLIDQAEVQPTGYWLIPTPNAREVTVSIKGPPGLIISPQSLHLTFPFHSNSKFQISGFSLIGSIETRNDKNENVPVTFSIPILVEGDHVSIRENSLPDGTFSIGPLIPGKYRISLERVLAENKTVKIEFDSLRLSPFTILDWPHNGTVILPPDVRPRSFCLLLSGSVPRRIHTNEKGEFSISNLSVGHYKIFSGEYGVFLFPFSFSVTGSKLPVFLSPKFKGVSVEILVKFSEGNPKQFSDVYLDPLNMKTKTNESGIAVFKHVPPQNPLKIRINESFFKFSCPAPFRVETYPISTLQCVVTHVPLFGFVDCNDTEIAISGATTKAFRVENNSFSVSVPYKKLITVSASSLCRFKQTSFEVVPPCDAINFTKARSTVSGSISCIGDCDPSIRVFLKFSDTEFTSPVSSNGHFSFSMVEFETFQFGVKPSKDTVWPETVQDVIIGSEDVLLKETFSQKGFVFSITSSHSMDVKTETKAYHLERGLNRPLFVNHYMMYPSDCHLFEPIDLRKSQRIVSHDVRRKVSLSLPQSYKRNFTVFLNGEVLPPPYEFVQTDSETGQPEISIKVKSPYIVSPKMIKPKMIDKCKEADIKFEVFPGVKVKGKFTPLLENASISLHVSGSNETFNTKSNYKGEYSFGTFPENSRFSISAHHKGYYLTQVAGTFDFVALRLASINISISSETSIDESEILFALSRQDGFSRNHKSTEMITELSPGTYFLKPILREHKFTPPQFMIELEAGQTFNVEMIVNRYQYGISGTARRITGEREPDIEIKAIKQNGEHQVVVTDINGNFRIGGFDPNQSVILFASSNTANIRVTPTQLKVFIEEEDFNAVKFTTVKHIQTFDLVGNVIINRELLPDVTVFLMNSHQVVLGRFEFSSEISNLFHFMKLSPGNYTVSAADNRVHGGNIVCLKKTVEAKRFINNIEIECFVIQQKVQIRVQKSQVPSTFLAVASVVLFFGFFSFHSITVCFHSFFG